MNNDYIVYYHTFPNGKMYFGQTCMKPEKRWGSNGIGYKTQPLMWRAIQKYGWDNIEHRIISIVLDKEEADFQEMFYISSYRTNEPEFGYNITDGGGGAVGYKHTEESKQKMSNSRKGKLKTEEWKQKIGESNKGNKKFLGKHHSEETKEKMRKPKSEEFKNMMSNVMRGRIVSEETRKKMSISTKGKLKPKYKWITPDGEIKEMSMHCAKQHHPDWKLIKE